MNRSGTQPRKLLEQNVETIIKELELAGMLNKDQFQFVIESSISVLKFQPNILKISSPAIVVGDIHGQFFDLIAIFRKHGLPPQTKYVFLGDYVDRGDFSIQVITILFWLKLKYPKSIYLLRGNHQCRVLTNTHNFKQECKSKYNVKIYELVIILFQVLPLCCILDGKYFCVHAGISPSLANLDQIQKINRFCEIPVRGIMCDLLWSDPTDEQKKEWTFNTMRSCSYFYSREHAENFLKKNKLEMIIRGHQVQLEGFKYMQYKKKNRNNVLTVFSAPNYCDKYNNLGAVAIIQNSNIRLDSFRGIQHPYILPNNANIFEWSIGIIANQATKILIQLIKSRLSNDKIGKSKQLQSTDKIKQEIQLASKVDELKKMIDNKEKSAQNQLCNRKQIQNFPLPVPISEEGDLDTEKCIITILMFMSRKKDDQKDEAMPTNQDQIQMIRDEQKLIYGDLTNLSQDGSRINDQHDQIQKERIKVGNKKQKYFSRKSSSPPPVFDEVESDGEKNNHQDVENTIPMNDKSMSAKNNLFIIGPKIATFAKIFPKRK